MSDKTKKTPLLYDIAIVGGGINGCGIARDAAGRGLKTYLCDKGDLGGETSCYSSKLIHGGLRYLEFYEFSLVRKALKERDTLMSIAPHLVKEQRFVIPHNTHLRPRWLIRLGLFLYDNLHWSKYLQGSHALSLHDSPLKDTFKHGFTYSDCVTDDHRLVIANALDAQNNGASINPYTICTRANVIKGYWQLLVKDSHGKGSYIYAKTLVNATGPWVEDFIMKELKFTPNKSLRLVKGSHIVTKKLYNGNQAYTFQDKQGRVVFTVPYQDGYTLIGTTEEEFDGNPSDAEINTQERAYLTSVMNEYFETPLKDEDIIWHFSGVRPLIKEGDATARQASRDYSIELNQSQNLPFVNVWGGKLTTYRVLAEDVLTMLAPYIGQDKAWSGDTALNTAGTITNITHSLMSKYTWLDATIVSRYAQIYGLNSAYILKDCTQMTDLGKHYGAGLYNKEIEYLIDIEWATTAEAILWRRTKCGLKMSKKQREHFADTFPDMLKERQSAQNIAKFEQQALDAIEKKVAASKAVAETELELGETGQEKNPA
ncbi:MAG: glycerol-3-phosphate dehydrogenase [bacterium]|jgi:glycerol-3-phosphate dehydrogenase